MKAYFPKLDSIRFYAFLMVFVSHIYIFCYHVSPTTSVWFLEHGPKIFAHGEIGVHIFFTLSGFLIMFLAIREYKNKQSFSILGFFRRRILRIWPVYFLALVGGILIGGGWATASTCIHRFWYFLGNTCMANGVMTVSDTTALVGPLWSVSVEEQFYVTFPFLFALAVFLIRKWGKKAGYFFGVLAAVALIVSLYQRYIHSENWDYVSYTTIAVLPSLFLGMALAVCVSVEKWKGVWAAWVKRNARLLKLIAVLFFFLSLYTKFSEALGVSIYIVLLCVSTMSMILLSIYGEASEPETKVQKTSRYLGRISYGLYAYHMFALLGVKHLFASMGVGSDTLMALLVQAIVILGVTILIAHLSYRYIEKAFLRLK